MRIRSVAVAWTAGMSVALSVTACNPDAPAQKSVWGHRDDIRTVAAVKEKSHQEKKTKRVCSRRKDGKCKSYKTIPDGTRKVVDRAAKPALYCVELDDVNGSAKDDDVWYATTQVVYLKAASLSEGDTIKFLPLHGGCW